MPEQIEFRTGRHIVAHNRTVTHGNLLLSHSALSGLLASVDYARIARPFLWVIRLKIHKQAARRGPIPQASKPKRRIRPGDT